MFKHFAVIDAGNDGISAIAARWAKNGEYVLEGFHRGRSGGLVEGVVTDDALATDRIRETLSALKKKTGKNFHHVYSAASSPSVAVIPSGGSILISKYGREVSERDMNRCADISSTVKVPLDRVILHKVVRGFSIDGERPIRDPINLEAVKLGADVRIITINGSVVKNLSKCIAQAGYVPQKVVFSGLAASRRIISREEELGETAFVNVHGLITEVLLFSGGSLENSRVFSKGSNDLLSL
jgi:cell division protein FtsA